jgi:hypothetical protein
MDPQDESATSKTLAPKWGRSPLLVNDHDSLCDPGWESPTAFMTRLRTAAPVCVGVSDGTPAFAANSNATWWKREGLRGYGRVPKLLVLADSGGSNSCTSWAWEIALQTQICNPFGLAVTIAHHPTGASKWNPLEHRLFSEISKDWAADPPSTATKRCSSSFAQPPSNRPGRDCLSRPKPVSNPSQARPTVDHLTPPHPWRNPSSMDYTVRSNL